MRPDTILDLNRVHSPRLEHLSFTQSPRAVAHFLAAGGLRCLRTFHCEETDLRHPYRENKPEAEADSFLQCHRLLKLPHLKVITGDCKMFRTAELEQSGVWQRTDNIAQEDSILRKILLNCFAFLEDEEVGQVIIIVCLQAVSKVRHFSLLALSGV